MKNYQFGNSRRGFIRNTLFTAGVLMVTLRIGANKKSLLPNIIGCGPDKKFSPQGTIQSVKSGNWSDASVWGGSVPSPFDTPEIATGHTIVFDLDSSTVNGMNIKSGGVFTFDPAKTTTLQSSANVVVEGKLNMHPSFASVKHTLRFVDVDETKFVGGGMDVLATDVGLWVMGDGALELVGASKTSWTNAAADVAQGSSSFSVLAAAGWLVDDEICISPTQAPTAGDAAYSGFDESQLKQISGTSVTLQDSVSRSHPKVNNLWTAEVMNLTRNVCIEGTPDGKAHIFIRSTAKQFIQYAAIRHMGPRKDKNGDGVTELVPGRYGLHFHHCEDGSRGSLVKGNVIRDTYNHSYVPHMSHQITFKDNVSYNTWETSFWWDPGDATHDVVYDHNIVAKCNFFVGSLNMDAENAPTFSSSGFALNTGDGNICNNNVVVGGSQGDAADGGAYNWEAVTNEGVWTFDGNTSHNNGCGLRVWQNSTRNHVIENFTCYNNGTGIFHGAYANSYTYNGGHLFANVFQVKAASVNSNRVRIENLIIDGGGLIDHGVELIHSPLPGERPVIFRNLTIRNCKVAAILDVVEPEIHSVDIVQCDVTGLILLDQIATMGEEMRVQPKNGTPYKISKSGTANISKFAPQLWGTGKGLKGEYYNASDFTNLVLTRIDSNISFSEWSTGVHYAITGNAHSMRWTGKIQPQYSEDYTFTISAGGGFRFWIDNNLILEKWEDNYPDDFNAPPLTMEAGKLYDIKIEYFNTDSNTGAGLSWSSASLPGEYVPQSQLYTEALPPVVEPEGPGGPDEPGGPNQPPSEPPAEENNFIVTTIAKEFIEVRSNKNTFYQLYDTQGRFLKRGNLVQGLNQVTVSSYAKGVLLLKVNNVRAAYKVVKI